MGTPLPSLQMCCEVGAPPINVVVKAATANQAAAEQGVLPKFAACHLLPSFATSLGAADFYLYWEAG